MKAREACIALNQISGIGYVRFSALVDHFGSAGEVGGKTAPEYRAVSGINSVIAEKLSKTDFQALAEEEMALAERSGVRILTLYDEGYPAILRDLHDPPLCLYVRGRLPAFPCKGISIVGSRKMSRYGEGMTRAITTDAVCAGYTIISGLAYGVDTTAHQTTLESGGTTLAVLGGGLCHVHPQENIPLAQDIVSCGGALITEFPMNCPVSRNTFPRRNRIIAALSPGTLVVEAGLKSGAIITALAALELGREVFAVPGQVTNEQAKGCHKLIRDGAVLTETFDDIRRTLEEFSQPSLLPSDLFQDEEKKTYKPASLSDLDPTSAEILRNIPSSGISLEDLAGCTGIEMTQLLSCLMHLEFKFLVKQGGDMFFYPVK